MVRALWCSVLALPEVGLEDDFFELGGDSLAAESLMTRMTSELGVPTADAQTTVLVQAPTLQQFAERVTRKVDVHHQTLIPLRPSGSRPPLFLLTGGGGLGVTLVPWFATYPKISRSSRCRRTVWRHAAFRTGAFSRPRVGM